MKVRVESVVTSILFLLLIAVTMCQGQRRSCNAYSTPHPRGLCGTRLATAHQNLCLLLRNNYPHVFSDRKRAVSDSIDSNAKIFKVPLSKLPDLDPANDEWKSHVQRRASTSRLTKYFDSARERTALNLLGEEGLAELFTHSVQKRNSSSGMVCDCCINQCTINDLATYC